MALVYFNYPVSKVDDICFWNFAFNVNLAPAILAEAPRLCYPTNLTGAFFKNWLNITQLEVTLRFLSWAQKF